MKPHRNEHNKEDDKSEHWLYDAISVIKTSEEAKLFLEDLCTPAELEALSDRWKVVNLLKEGKPYREIYKETGVSLTPIGRVARYLMLGHGGYHVIYERLKKQYVKIKPAVKNRITKKRQA